MHIARTTPKTRFYELLCGEFLSTVDSAKNLGVVIFKDLEKEGKIFSSEHLWMQHCEDSTILGFDLFGGQDGDWSYS